jgi:hypothetical protein
VLGGGIWRGVELISDQEHLKEIMKVKHLKALLDLQDPESEIGSTNQEGIFIPELEITNGFVNQWSKDNGYF